jgi:hypothetical protein
VVGYVEGLYEVESGIELSRGCNVHDLTHLNDLQFELIFFVIFF